MSNEVLTSAASELQPSGWNEAAWKSLLLSIRAKKCTPFLGAGACWGVLPLGGQIAEQWAKEFGYPFQDNQNLVRVAQFVGSMHGRNYPKLLLQQRFQDKCPDFEDADEPHRVVADLKLPVYITTNYDDFMLKALLCDGRSGRKPTRASCPWHLARRGRVRIPEFEPSENSPVVFHLHGNFDDIQSLVLTEDDYLDFLTVAIEHGNVIPPAIEKAFGDSAFLFLGYSLEDLNFKVLFRKLATYLGGNSFRHVAVQLAPATSRPRPGISTNSPAVSTAESLQPSGEELERAERQRAYLEKEYGLIQVQVFWGTCRQFVSQLRRKWSEYQPKA